MQAYYSDTLSSYVPSIQMYRLQQLVEQERELVIRGKPRSEARFHI